MDSHKEELRSQAISQQNREAGLEREALAYEIAKQQLHQAAIEQAERASVLRRREQELADRIKKLAEEDDLRRMETQLQIAKAQSEMQARLEEQQGIFNAQLESLQKVAATPAPKAPPPLLIRPSDQKVAETAKGSDEFADMPKLEKEEEQAPPPEPHSQPRRDPKPDTFCFEGNRRRCSFRIMNAYGRTVRYQCDKKCKLSHEHSVHGCLCPWNHSTEPGGGNVDEEVVVTTVKESDKVNLPKLPHEVFALHQLGTASVCWHCCCFWEV